VHHSKIGQRMSEMDQKQTFVLCHVMSALPPKADIRTLRYCAPYCERGGDVSTL
jgi:hypothetical protein